METKYIVVAKFIVILLKSLMLQQLQQYLQTKNCLLEKVNQQNKNAFMTVVLTKSSSTTSNTKAKLVRRE